MPLCASKQGILLVTHSSMCVNESLSVPLFFCSPDGENRTGVLYRGSVPPDRDPF